MKIDNFDDLIVKFGFVIEEAVNSKANLNFKDIVEAFEIAIGDAEDAEEEAK